MRIEALKIVIGSERVVKKPKYIHSNFQVTLLHELVRVHRLKIIYTKRKSNRASQLPSNINSFPSLIS